MKFVYDLGPNIPIVIKNMATELIVGSKIISLNEINNERNYTVEQKKEDLLQLFDKKENKEIINKQLPYWELLTGICLICGILIESRDSLTKLKEGITTWDNLLSKED